MFELLKNGPYVCIHCGYGGNRNVYKIYGDQINYHCRSPSSALDLDVQRSRSTTPRLTKCSKCFDFVDDYVQLDYNILYLDAILQRKTFYRHILLNCEILSKKLALKMALVFFFCDAFQRWTTYNGVTFTASKTDDGIHLDTSLSTLMIGLMSNIVSDQIIASIISPPISSSTSAKQISRNYFQLEISFYYNFLYTTIENIIFNILFFYNFCFFIWFFKQPIITKMISRFRIFDQKTATHLKTSQSEMNELTHYSESNLETDQSSSTSSTMNQYEMIKLCNFNELFMSLIICSYGKLFLIPSNLYGGDWKPILDLSIQIFYLLHWYNV
ncbi:hypothetical protein SSS_10767 [Sarcoptes scabiei]|uniref:Protein ARV n=1 Tax=Sarcoptes scabiei TaxID=52283 RepID=A0A834VAE8_SARSC|nr:hypothetical protein SSS_10767 [Sarcoptes scabiei]